MLLGDGAVDRDGRGDMLLGGGAVDRGGEGICCREGAVDRDGINAVREQEISVRVLENHMGNEDFSSFIDNYGYLGRIF